MTKRDLFFWLKVQKVDDECEEGDRTVVVVREQVGHDRIHVLTLISYHYEHHHVYAKVSLIIRLYVAYSKFCCRFQIERPERTTSKYTKLGTGRPSLNQDSPLLWLNFRFVAEKTRRNHHSHSWRTTAGAVQFCHAVLRFVPDVLIFLRHDYNALVDTEVQNT